MILCQHHIIPVARPTCAVQKPCPPRHSCGNHCFVSIRENLKGLVACLAFCCCCLCFYLLWSPWRSHEQRASFRWTAVPSLLPAAHPDEGSPRNRPHAVEFCSVWAFTRFSVFIPLFSQCTATTAMCACCLYVCVCVTVGRVGSIECWLRWCNVTVTAFCQGHF